MYMNQLVLPKFDVETEEQILTHLHAIDTEHRASVKKVMEAMLWYSFRHKDMYMSQETIGRLTNLCRETVNRALQIIKSLGILKWKRRINSSCLYFLNPIFKDLQFLEKIRGIFNAVNSYLFKKVTQYSLLGYLFLNNVQRYKEYTPYACARGSVSSVLSLQTLQKQKDSVRTESNINRKSERKVMNQTTFQLLKSLGLDQKDIQSLENYPDKAISEVVAYGKKRPQPVSNWVAYITGGCRKWVEKQSFVRPVLSKTFEPPITNISSTKKEIPKALENPEDLRRKLNEWREMQFVKDLPRDTRDKLEKLFLKTIDIAELDWNEHQQKQTK